MKFIGFGLNKIFAEKNNTSFKNINIDNNLSIIKIKKLENDFIPKGDILSIDFDYSINYNPDFAKINYKGSLLVSLDSENIDEILEEWKNKKLNDNFQLKITNIIFRKLNIKALQLEEEMNLPHHISLPTIKKKED